MESDVKWTKLRSTLKPKEFHLNGSLNGLKDAVIQALLVQPGKRTNIDLSALISYFGMVRDIFFNEILLRKYGE